MYPFPGGAASPAESWKNKNTGEGKKEGEVQERGGRSATAGRKGNHHRWPGPLLEEGGSFLCAGKGNI